MGIEIVQLKGDGSKSQLDSGIIQQSNCSVEVNCTFNMHGHHVYYLSGIESLHLTVISTATPNGDSNLDVDIRLRTKTTGYLIYILISLTLLVIFGFGFEALVSWMKEQLSSTCEPLYVDTENLDSAGERHSHGEAAF